MPEDRVTTRDSSDTVGVVNAIVSTKIADVLAALLMSPEYTAVMASLPSGSVARVRLACPLESCAVPSRVLPLKKPTLPPGTKPLVPPLMLAVKVTAWVRPADEAELVNVVTVAGGSAGAAGNGLATVIVTDLTADWDVALLALPL